MTPDRKGVEVNKEITTGMYAVFGHDDHTFKIRLSELPGGILPNAPECSVYEKGKRCGEISELIEIKSPESQS